MISPFTNASGSAIRFWNMALELERHGFDVVYIDRKITGGTALFVSKKIKYYSCPGTSSQFLDIVFSTVFNFLIFVRHINCSIFYLLKPAPNNGFSAILAQLLGKKVLLDIDDLDYAYLSPGLKYNLYKLCFDKLARMFPLVTFHTPNLKKYIIETLKVDAMKTYYLAQGVTESFLAINIQKIKKIPKSLLYVATLGITSDFEDCIPMLFEICKIVPDVKIHIVGDGERKRFFEKEIKNAGFEKQIIFTGRKKHNELPAFVAQHQIGINYMRTTPVNSCRAILKIREYIACGLQVVCNDTGDAELFKDVIFIENDIGHMQKRITSLLNSPFQRNMQGMELMRNEYCWKDIMSKFVSKLQEIN